MPNHIDHKLTYSSWMNMLQRCTNPNSKSWKHYGGRGITVCARWIDFDNFLLDMGERLPDLQLDRIDNDGNYERGNCRWTTPLIQANNRRNSIGGGEPASEFIGVNVKPSVKAGALAASDREGRSLADWVRLAMEAAIAAEGKRK